MNKPKIYKAYCPKCGKERELMNYIINYYTIRGFCSCCRTNLIIYKDERGLKRDERTK
jgi:hypothetical protein